MFQKSFLSSLFLFCALAVFAQKDEVNFTGKITDAAEAPLQGANVWLAELRRGGASDKNGKFEVPDVPPGVYSVEVSFVGYKKLTKTISITGEASRFTENFSLEKQVTDLSVLTVKSTRVDLQSPFTFTNLSKEAIEKNNLGLDVPFLLQWTPSAVVTSDAGNGIGYTGIRIRGSDPTRINVTINGIPLNDAESQNVFWVDLPDFASSTADI
ncbi:MAG TPA: TonB-dependent receptor, partial [Saprospiraceae bacterium]|nr:TonB-dependent receptor [Saprospiraceae bacterium]